MERRFVTTFCNYQIMVAKPRFGCPGTRKNLAARGALVGATPILDDVGSFERFFVFLPGSACLWLSAQKASDNAKMLRAIVRMLIRIP